MSPWDETFAPIEPETMEQATKDLNARLGHNVRFLTLIKIPLVCCVQGFSDAGTDKASRALVRPASEKRQGTKSREVGHGRCREFYGDLGTGKGGAEIAIVGHPVGSDDG
jgi:hypothetical protein